VSGMYVCMYIIGKWDGENCSYIGSVSRVSIELIFVIINFMSFSPQADVSYFVTLCVISYLLFNMRFVYY
jgi:predicted Na+-dependent transporter